MLFSLLLSKIQRNTEFCLVHVVLYGEITQYQLQCQERMQFYLQCVQYCMVVFAAKQILVSNILSKTGYHEKWERYTAQKMKFSIKDFFSKCDQVRSFLRIRSHLLRKSLMENFICCAATFVILCEAKL